MRLRLVSFVSALSLLACLAASPFSGGGRPTTRPVPAKRFRSTPLIQAIGEENAKQALALIADGADVEATDTHGGAPLYYAAGAQDPEFVEVVQALIARGADVSRKSRGGATALHEACFWGRQQTVKALIQSGAAVGAVDNFGDTPLHSAVYCNLPERTGIMKLLISAGADVSAIDVHSKKPLDVLRERHPNDAASINLLKQATLQRPSTAPATKPSSRR